MPHETYLTRELPISVDFVDQDEKWTGPSESGSWSRFEGGEEGGDWAEARRAVLRLQETLQLGLFDEPFLGILNDEFRRHYFKESSPDSETERVYDRVLKRGQEELGIPREACQQSTIVEWPLYHFAASPR